MERAGKLLVDEAERPLVPRKNLTITTSQRRMHPVPMVRILCLIILNVSFTNAFCTEEADINNIDNLMARMTLGRPRDLPPLVGLLSGKWKKVGVSPLNADWGAETIRGLFVRACLSFVIVASVGIVTQNVIGCLYGDLVTDDFVVDDLKEIAPIPFGGAYLSWGVLTCLLPLLPAIYWVRRTVKNIQECDEWFVWLNRVLALLWEFHNAGMDLINSVN